MDLDNYRRTVQKTREELLLAETEREKVESIASGIRTHFLHHLRASDQESHELASATSLVISSLSAAAADAGCGKAGGVKGAMMLMKALGESGTGKKKKGKKTGKVAPPAGAQGGIGGVPIRVDEGGSILGVKEQAGDMASAWLLPGDAVKTAYGVGTVEAILPQEEKKEKNLQGSVGTSGVQQSGMILVPPRVKVALDYGTCYMLPGEVTSIVRITELTDTELVKRWIGVLETSHLTGGYVDEDAMSMAPGGMGYDIPTGDAELYRPGGGFEREVNGNAIEVDGNVPRSSGVESRLVRFGGAMIPTPGGRGASMKDVKIQQLRQTISGAVSGRQIKDPGFVASSPSLVLPDSFAEWEEERLEIYKLKGHMLQLKKVLRRQEISKSLTEKAVASARTHLEKQTTTRGEMTSELR